MGHELFYRGGGSLYKTILNDVWRNIFIVLCLSEVVLLSQNTAEFN